MKVFFRATVLLVLLFDSCPDVIADSPVPVEPPSSIRVATMNVSLYGESAGQVAERIAAGTDAQAIKLSRIIRTIRPDILLLCEVDYDETGVTLDRFVDQYLSATRDDPSAPIEYPYRWSIPTNTGLFADFDLDEDGQTAIPGDAWGFGKYPGQYAMAVLSRYPIDRKLARTFQTYLWSDLPGALRPIDPRSGQSYHSDNVWKRLRLSSKNHVDVPITISWAGGGERTLHFLVSHPTPPVFDGPEDRNGCRNHDEIRFWRDYVSNPEATHLVDDRGMAGGLGGDAAFVIAGDLNSDPVRGDSRQEGIRDLIACTRVQDAAPKSERHATATASFGTRSMRVDYVLPSDNLRITDSGVVWPAPETFLGRCLDATDHRLVWVDLDWK